MKFFGLLVLLAILGYISRPDAGKRQAKKESLNAPGRISYCSPSFDPSKMETKEAPLFNNPGTIHYEVTTRSKLAQRYFDQGLTMLYAFNHGEAGRSFMAAIEHDSTLAMAYWGLAMVLGPNYNAALNPSSLEDINAALGNASRFSAHASPREKALIAALSLRFPGEEVADMQPFNAAYAAAMKEVYQQYPDDAEIAATFADALMNEHPWNFWLKDGTAQPWTGEVMATLGEMLGRWPNHPAICHLYIHATEASKTPEKALPYADRLSELMPAAGHIVHMPSHTYLRTGDYHKAVLVNEKASRVDSTYIAQCKVAGAVPLLYYPHNIHFLAVAAFLEGNSRKAIDAAWMIQRNASREFINENATVQHYYSIPYYVLVQFGRWDEILQLKYPGEMLKYPAAIWHYARGMAFAAKGDLEKAGNELWALNTIASDESLGKLMIWETNSAAQIVAIASHVLSGEMAAWKKEYKKAFEAFGKAIAIEDALNYQEPPDWFFSVRHTLGHWLMKAGESVRAEKVYLEDLSNFRENGWALIGLYNSLHAQGRDIAATEAKQRFERAWKWADRRISSSRVY